MSNYLPSQMGIVQKHNRMILATSVIFVFVFFLQNTTTIKTVLKEGALSVGTLNPGENTVQV